MEGIVSDSRWKPSAPSRPARAAWPGVRSVVFAGLLAAVVVPAAIGQQGGVPSEAMRAGDVLAEGGDPGRKLVDAHFCLSCHGIDRKLVGPSFRDIAGKYAADAAARIILAGRIRSGGSGAWGTVPMPPNTGLSDAELELVVGYVFKYRP